MMYEETLHRKFKQQSEILLAERKSNHHLRTRLARFETDTGEESLYIQSLQRKLHQERGELKVMQRRVEESEKECARLDAFVKAQRVHIQLLESEQKRSTVDANELVEAEEKRKKAENQLKIARRENEELKTLLETEQSELLTLQRGINFLKEKLVTLEEREAEEALERVVQQLSEELLQIKQEKAHKERLIEALKLEKEEGLKEQLQQFDTLRNDYEALLLAKKEIQETFTLLSERQEKNKQIIDRQAEVLILRQGELEALEKEVALERQEREGLLKRLEETERALYQVSESEKVLKSELEAVSEEKVHTRALSEEKAALEFELEKIKSALFEKTQALDVHFHRANELALELKGAKEQSQKAHVLAEEARGELRVAQQHLAKKLKEITDLRMQLDRERADRGELFQKSEEMRRRQEELQTALERREETFKQVEEEKSRKLHELEKQLALATRELAKKSESASQLAIEVDRLKGFEAQLLQIRSLFGQAPAAAASPPVMQETPVEYAQREPIKAEEQLLFAKSNEPRHRTSFFEE